MNKRNLFIAIFIIILLVIYSQVKDGIKNPTRNSSLVDEATTTDTVIDEEDDSTVSDNNSNSNTETPDIIKLPIIHSSDDQVQDLSQVSTSTLLCRINFPIYRSYHNDYSKVFFYEDMYKTYLFTKNSDGTKTYSKSDKKDIFVTKYYNVEPNGSCSGYKSESFNPNYAAVYNPFACDQDQMLYGLCPITNFSKSIMIWKNSNKKILENQVGRAFGKYLIAGDSSTKLTDKSYRLVPKIDTKEITQLSLPLPDDSNTFFTYKFEEGETVESVADKFGLLMSDIYYSNPHLKDNYALKACFRVADKKSQYRIYCIDPKSCQNIGENTIQPVSNEPFTLDIFDQPKNCKLSDY